MTDQPQPADDELVPGLTYADAMRLQEITDHTLAAAVAKDADSVRDGIRQLLDPDGPFGPREGLAWVITMLWQTLAGQERPQGGGELAVPYAGRVRPDGTVEVLEVMDPSVPPGIRAYVQMGAALANDDKETVGALWLALVQSGEPHEVLRCMTTALTDAAAAVRVRRAQSN